MKHPRLLALSALLLLAAACAGSAPYPMTVVSITTEVPRATAEFVESGVTIPIERVLLSVLGVHQIRSQSSESRSYIEVNLVGVAAEQAVRTVEVALDRIQPQLPDSASRPVVKAAVASLLSPK